MEKRFRIFSLLAALFLLTGCAAGNDTVESPLEEAVIPSAKTVIQYYDSADSAQIASTIVAAFNAQSDDTFVELHLIDNDTYDNDIIQRLKNGDTSIDCLFLRQPCQVNQYAAEGLLWDLTDAVAQSELNPAAYGQTLDIISVSNTIPALPRTKSVWLLFYNRDIFDQYGIAEPSNLTWDEYAELTRRLTVKKEDGTMLYGGYIPPWTMNLGASAAGEYLYDDELPYTRKYIELLNRLYNVDHSHPDIAQMEGEYSQPYLVFLDQKIATMVNGDWAVYLFNNEYTEQSSTFRWGIATLPVFEDIPQQSSVGGCSYMAIPNSSAHKENAFAFISYFCGGEAADLLAKMPTCSAYYTESSAEGYQQNAGVPGAQYVFDSRVRNEEGTYVWYRELNITFKDCVLEYLRGNVSLDDAFQNFEAERLSILQTP